jgi:hypothetical protein
VDSFYTWRSLPKTWRRVVMLRYSPCGGTSKTAIVAVTTRGVPLLIWKNIIICFQLVAKLHVATQLRWRYLTFRHKGCCATSSILIDKSTCKIWTLTELYQIRNHYLFINAVKGIVITSQNWPRWSLLNWIELFGSLVYILLIYKLSHSSYTTNKSSATSQRATEFLAAHVMY